MTEFKLPELGENVHQGDLVRLMISPGANITEGQTVMELETDKAVVEVPSSLTGTVKEVRVKEGEKVKVGQVIFTVENGAGAKSRASSPEANSQATKKTADVASKNAASAEHAGPSEAESSHRASASAEGSGEKRAASAAKSKTAADKAVIPPRDSTAQPGASEFKLPELGENISQGDLVRLLISAGDKVSEGQPVMELETDKAVVEVPSSVNGVVKDVNVKQGEKVKVGQVIFTLEAGSSEVGSSEIGSSESRPSVAAPAGRHMPVEHPSEQHGARLSFQAAIEAEGKTE
ncbi:MAG: biotin/lipoyl-containing protein, partial [Terriglobales bacterium]